MGILVDQDTRVIFQGLTGATATRMAERAIASGTKVVGGVTPGKGGSKHLSLPVFDSVAEAAAETRPDATGVFVPPAQAATAMIEAIEAEIPLVVCVTERVPVLDMVRVKQALAGSKTRVIGPNSYGIMTPEACRIGVMPDRPHKPGRIGIASRSATLAYEAVAQTTRFRLGQSTSVGIGGDPVHGLDFVDCLELFLADPKTAGIVLIGEIGGHAEQDAAAFLEARKPKKPVVAYVAGVNAPPERRMGHAGTVDLLGQGDVMDKIRALEQAGVIVVESANLIGHAMRQALDGVS
ncbi:MAG: succinate--CoA ligase subunit alpha [Kiloniellales bacterium]|nr:succinate--CoA ligase subunit alpha [Kiloniellales bacterium]